MAKTPYEIRSDLLSLASAHLINEYNSKLALLKSLDKVEAAMIAINLLTEPEFPTIDQVMECALRFQQFVNESR